MAFTEYLDLILIALAAYRLATDLAEQDGPFDLFTRGRGWAVTRFGPNHWIARGVHCTICLSLWTSLVLLVVAPVMPFVLAWLAVAGLVRVLLSVTP